MIEVYLLLERVSVIINMVLQSANILSVETEYQKWRKEDFLA